MLGLTLREEFLRQQMPATAIRLTDADSGGAAQQSPEQILRITYPTGDVQNALLALSANRRGKPILIMGERGRGKSHIMAVMHHALQSPDAVENWSADWGQRLASSALREFKVRRGYHPITEAVHNNEYPLLWKLLFDRHPQGQRFSGQFEALGQSVPPRKLLEDMFKAQPTALILDEFQTWFDGLIDDPGASGKKWRHWAFQFIQMLSELSSDRPDLLILVVSILSNQTEAFSQIHRDQPIVVDFTGPSARSDRQRLVMHRLFANRDTFSDAAIQSAVKDYASERFRLRYPHRSEAERDACAREVIASWPFSPELLELLDEQILMSQAAQETRDLIRILAQIFRARGDQSAILTPADFAVDDDLCGVQTLIDSIANMVDQVKLREVAQRNLETVRDVCPEAIHARDFISALWMRSMSPGRSQGGTRQELHLDITRGKAIDDNSYQVESSAIIQNSVNIHGEENPEGRLRFGPEENPRAKVRAVARNHRLWRGSGAESATTFPGKDIEHVRNTLVHLFSPETRQQVAKVLVLGPAWSTDPWSDLDEKNRPQAWDEPVLVALPEPVGQTQSEISALLGPWLARFVDRRRNTVRFLLPAADQKCLYTDEELIHDARCSYLVTHAWKTDPLYRGLKTDFDNPLRDRLKARYDRFAILHRWNYQSPESCLFDVERIGAKGEEIPAAVEAKVLQTFYDPAEFEQFVCQRAEQLPLMGDILDELADPPTGSEAIPYLGENLICESVLKIVAKGRVAVRVGDSWIRRQADQGSEEEALPYIHSKAFRSGPELRKICLGPPNAVGGGVVPGTSPVARPAAPVQPTTGSDQPLPVPPPPAPSGVADGGGSSEPNSTPTPAGPRGGADVVKRSEEPNTGINLSASFEKWGLGGDVTVDQACIGLSGMTVQQIKQVLMRIPSSVKASLEVHYRKEGDG